jgi:uncharacterized oligopeptide transporter (OPT) family protein
MDTPSIGNDEKQKSGGRYRGDTIPEFTVKAVITGGFVGALLMASNVYVGLKTGFFAGGSIFSAILCFVILRSFRTSFSVLENNIAQTVASAAASIGVVVSVLPALTMLGYEFSIYEYFIWLLAVSFLGVLFAVPLRKQSIDVEKLPFPSGTACAATITAMHADATDAVRKGEMLGLSGFLTAIIVWFRDAIPVFIPFSSFFPGKISGIGLNQLMIGFSWMPMLFGVGMLVGSRVGISLLLGSLIAFGVIGPMLVTNGIIETASFTEIRGWTMWPALAMMITAGLVSLLMKGNLFIQTLCSMKGASINSVGGYEFPFRKWLTGLIVSSIVICIVMQAFFNIPVWMSLLLIVIAFILTSVAVRTYGETDVLPAGQMGWTTQILFGALSPGNTLTNVMTGGISASGANTAGDVMGDFKAGYILGATPRRQTYGQFIGVVIGTCVALPVFFLLTSVYTLGNAELPAPAGVSWSGLANVLVEGFRALPPYSTTGVYIGILSGVLLSIGSNTNLRRFIPSPIGIGVAMLLPATMSFSIFAGAMIAVMVKKAYLRWWETYSMPLASGLIAGEAVVGLIIILLQTVGAF